MWDLRVTWARKMKIESFRRTHDRDGWTDRQRLPLLQLLSEPKNDQFVGWLWLEKKKEISYSENNFLDSHRITVKMLPNSIFNFYLHLSFLAFSLTYLKPLKLIEKQSFPLKYKLSINKKKLIFIFLWFLVLIDCV